MAKAKETSVKKSIRIPEKTASEITKEAEKKFNNNFSDAAVYRLQHFKAPITPAIMSKLQNIANTAIGIIKDNNPQKAEEIQKEVNALWKYLR